MDYKNNITISTSGLVIFVLLFACSCYPCFNLKQRQTLNQDAGVFLSKSSMFEGGGHQQQDNVIWGYDCVIILFNNGYILSVPGDAKYFFDYLESEKDFRIYGTAGAFQWGKYYLKGDSIKIEFVSNISSGGGCKVRAVRYSGLLRQNELIILPGPDNPYKIGPTQHVLAQDGLNLSFVQSISDSLIDPTKANLLK